MFLQYFLNKINDALHTATNYFRIWCEIGRVAPRVISEWVSVDEKDVIYLMYSQPTTDFDLNNTVSSLMNFKNEDNENTSFRIMIRLFSIVSCSLNHDLNLLTRWLYFDCGV